MAPNPMPRPDPHRLPRRRTTAKASKSESNAKSKTKSSGSLLASISASAQLAESKQASDGEEEAELELEAHYKSEHYLKVSKTVSRAKFTAIDVLSPEDIVPLKRRVMAHPTNERLKRRWLDRVRAESYGKWLVELKSGFNLLFYGVGSKKSVLEDFGKLFCCRDPNGITIRVNGFSDDLSLRAILDALCEVIVEEERRNRAKKNGIKSDKDLAKRAENVVRYLEDEGVRHKLQYTFFYLIVHNITGKMLRKRKSQRVLSVLANCRCVHLIASIDHIHGLLLWDRTALSSFHWIYHEVTTYKHFFEEMEFEKDQTIKLSNNGAHHGLQHIMASLTPQHRDIIEQLALQQMDCDGLGLSEARWSERCCNAMLVSTEFLDHNVIAKELASGAIIYRIPYSNEVIQRELIDYGLADE